MWLDEFMYKISAYKGEEYYQNYEEIEQAYINLEAELLQMDEKKRKDFFSRR